MLAQKSRLKINGSSDHHGSNGSGRKWLDYGCTLMAEPTGFPDWWDGE